MALASVHHGLELQVRQLALADDVGRQGQVVRDVGRSHGRQGGILHHGVGMVEAEGEFGGPVRSVAHLLLDVVELVVSSLVVVGLGRVGLLGLSGRRRCRQVQGVGRVGERARQSGSAGSGSAEVHLPEGVDEGVKRSSGDVHGNVGSRGEKGIPKLKLLRC